MTLSYPSISSANDWADLWYDMGLKPIPRNGKTPMIKYGDLRGNPLQKELFEQWKTEGKFDINMCIMVDKVVSNTSSVVDKWAKEDSPRYLNFADLDNQKAIDEFCTWNGMKITLEEISKHVMIVQHEDDKTHCHIYWFSKKPMKRRTLDTDSKIVKKIRNNEVPAIEIKGEGDVAFCPGGKHENGFPYLPIGIHEPLQSEEIGDHINSILTKYQLPLCDKDSNGGNRNNSGKFNAKNLFSFGEKVREGARNNTIFDLCRKVISNNRDLPEAIVKKLCFDCNQELCEPPLSDTEVESIFKSAQNYIAEEKNNNTNNDESGTTNSNSETLLTVLQAKRIHSGNVKVIGKIVTVSDMFTVEKINEKMENLQRDARFIQLEDTEKLDENERLDVMLYDDMIENVRAGETVEIKGFMLLQEKNKNSKTKIGVLHAESIKYVNRKELKITSEDIIAFEKFAKNPNLIQNLVRMFAPNIIAHEDVKLGLLRSIVGGNKYSNNGLSEGDGERINTFLVGDFGTAKSSLAEEAAKIKPNSRHVSAPHATAKTITAIVEKENDSPTLKLGSIPLARDAICSIDELDAFSIEEQSRLLDVLQKSFFDVEKNGRHYTVSAPTTIIATANPNNGSKWNDSENISLDEVGIRKSLLSRFQQIYIFRDNMDGKQIDEFAKQMSVIKGRRLHNYYYLSGYLMYASQIKLTTMTPEAEYMLNHFWKEAKKQGTMDIRMYKGIFSIAEAQAKLHLKDTIDAEIAMETMESIQLMMVQIGPTVQATQNPKTLTKNKCLDILQSNQSAGITVSELFKTARKDNQQISDYIGNNFTTSGNSKVRAIVDQLRNHSKIKTVSLKPLVLQWIEEKSSENQGLCDVYDVCEETKNENENENISNFGSSHISHVSYISDSDSKPTVSNTGVKPVEGVTYVCLNCKQLLYSDELSRELHEESCSGNVPTQPE